MDSASLLAAAVRALGAEYVVAATTVSPSLARRWAGPTPRRSPQATALHSPTSCAGSTYVGNGADRCFYCNPELLDVLNQLARDCTLRPWRRAHTPTTRRYLPAKHPGSRSGERGHASGGCLAEQGAGAHGLARMGLVTRSAAAQLRSG